MMKPMIHITICPSCGSTHLNRVKKNWVGMFQGKSYTIPSLEFYECPNCDEHIYDRQAMRRIEAHSPAFVKRHPQKISEKSPESEPHEEKPVLANSQ